MALAGDHDNVPVSRRLEHALDRATAVELNLEIEAVHDLGRNYGGILAPRIVRRHERDVGELCDHLSHQRPLHAVSISACAEDANDATAPKLACRLQDGLERPGRVRVVDEDRERLSFVDLVEAAWNAADGLDSCSDRGLIHAESTRDRKSTRLNSSHVAISYAVFCLKKK